MSEMALPVSPNSSSVERTGWDKRIAQIDPSVWNETFAWHSACMNWLLEKLTRLKPSIGTKKERVSHEQ
jgi:hypothetical protein